MLKPKEPTDTRPGTGQPDVIGQWGKTRLVRYQARGPRRHPVPVLIVSPLLAKPYVLDLAPGLSLVDHLVERGLELFLLDFGIPDRRDRELRFEDHLRVVDRAMRELLAQTEVKRATLLGYCLGGIFATLYAATHPAKVENLVTLATPVDFSRAGPVYRYVRTLDVDGLVDRLGNVPGRVDQRPNLGAHDDDDARTQPADLARTPVLFMGPELPGAPATGQPLAE
jgi:polyhydroxyalkanoate synthase